jgi:hypothetical protein
VAAGVRHAGVWGVEVGTAVGAGDQVAVRIAVRLSRASTRPTSSGGEAETSRPERVRTLNPPVEVDEGTPSVPSAPPTPLAAGSPGTAPAVGQHRQDERQRHGSDCPRPNDLVAT